MGSIIEVFPRNDAGRPLRRNIALGTEPVSATGAPKVRATRLVDYAAIRALQREAHPRGAGFTLQQLESRRRAFPDGQLVAERDGQIVGAASALVVQWDDYALHPTWKAVTGDGYFSTHDTVGLTLYGADVVIDIGRHGAGAGRALFQAQRRLCRKLNLRRIISAVHLGAYHEHRDEMSPELYAQRVIWGDLFDPQLRLHLAHGFQYCGILRDYHPEDLESHGNAALVVWLNPFHTPDEPPALRSDSFSSADSSWSGAPPLVLHPKGSMDGSL